MIRYPNTTVAIVILAAFLLAMTCVVTTFQTIERGQGWLVMALILISLVLIALLSDIANRKEETKDKKG